VLESDAYRKLSWGSFSPWTKRILNKVKGQYRASGDQIHPGDALTGQPCRMTLIRVRNVPDVEAELLVKGVRANYESRPETSQIRVFRSTYNDANDYIALVEAHAPFERRGLDLAPFGVAAQRIDIVNEYAPYWTRGALAGVFPKG
jgi:hypothetical protein